VESDKEIYMKRFLQRHSTSSILNAATIKAYGVMASKNLL